VPEVRSFLLRSGQLSSSPKVEFLHWCPTVISISSVVCIVGLLWIMPEEAGIVLELLDQKTRGFMGQIALQQWFLECAHQVFGEMPVRI
jgi:hypothetical protein